MVFIPLIVATGIWRRGEPERDPGRRSYGKDLPPNWNRKVVGADSPQRGSRTPEMDLGLPAFPSTLPIVLSHHRAKIMVLLVYNGRINLSFPPKLLPSLLDRLNTTSK